VKRKPYRCSCGIVELVGSFGHSLQFLLLGNGAHFLGLWQMIAARCGNDTRLSNCARMVTSTIEQIPARFIHPIDFIEPPEERISSYREASQRSVHVLNLAYIFPQQKWRI
jgi:hypothetical protein